ncbi:MAG TPA: 2-hydroxyacid dehydrogenase [Pelolinea sp.]|nr:2-hydroxyacid dehydrogenase [Pelolinea sp.]
MQPVLYAHIQKSPDEKALTYLTNQLDSHVSLSFGDTITDDDKVNILVSGRPTQSEIERFPNLKTVIIPWAGVSQETFSLLKKKPHIAIHNLHHNAVPVAEYALALMLSSSKSLMPMDRALRQSDWRPRYQPGTALLLSEKTALILGYGHIGRLIGAYMQAFNMHIMATRNSINFGQIQDNVNVYPSDKLHNLLPKTDYLIIALPHTERTEGMIGKKELALLPRHAVIVNIGRGAIIDQQALYFALRNHTIGAAGIDVWYNYPKDDLSKSNTKPAKYPFHELDNIVMSPHRAGGLNTDDTERLRMAHLAVLLNAAAKGEEISNRVDPLKGY